MATNFVPRTIFPEYRVALASFPGHHRRTLQTLKQMAFQIDLVLELRDARAPLSTMNPLLDSVLPGKSKFTLYTKSDMSRLKHSHLEALHPMGNYALIDTRSTKSAARVRRILREHASKQIPRPPLGTRVLITGMPNVGKSSLLNALKGSRKIARIGTNPGVTRSVSELVSVSVGRDEKVYVLDTPGVVTPKAYSVEHMLKLCLVGCVPRTLVDPVILADYLLFRVNLAHPFGGKYPGAPTNDVHEVLHRLAPRAAEETAVAANWVAKFSRSSRSEYLVLDTVNEDTIRDIQELGRLEAERLDLAGMPVDMRVRRRFMM